MEKNDACRLQRTQKVHDVFFSTQAVSGYKYCQLGGPSNIPRLNVLSETLDEFSCLKNADYREMARQSSAFEVAFHAKKTSSFKLSIDSACAADDQVPL